MGVMSESKRFLWNYFLFQGSEEEPPNDIGAVGDIFISRGIDRLWVRGADRWKVVEPQDAITQKPLLYPRLMSARCPGHSKLVWSLYSAPVHSSKSKKRRIHEDIQVAGGSQHLQVGEKQEPSIPELRRELNQPLDSSMMRPYQLPQESRHLGNPANAWLTTLHKFINIPLPLVERCKSVLEALMKRPDALDQFSNDGLVCLGPPKTTRSTRLTANHVIHDMIYGNPTVNGIDYHTGVGQNVRATDILSSMVADVRGDWTPTRRYWGVLQVLSTAQGIQGAGIDTSHFTENGDVHMQGQWETAYVPAGGITQPHTDYNSAGQYCIHIDGEKLWLTWPASAGNLEWLQTYRPVVGPIPNDLILRAIAELEGLRLHHFTASNQEVFTLEPSLIHAVLTLSNACHTGRRFYKKSHFDEAIRLAQNSLRIVEDRVPYGMSNERAIQDLEVVLFDLKQWHATTFLSQDQNQTLTTTMNALADVAQFINPSPPVAPKSVKKRKRTARKP